MQIDATVKITFTLEDIKKACQAHIQQELGLTADLEKMTLKGTELSVEVLQDSLPKSLDVSKNNTSDVSYKVAPESNSDVSQMDLDLTPDVDSKKNVNSGEQPSTPDPTPTVDSTPNSVLLPQADETSSLTKSQENQSKLTVADKETHSSTEATEVPWKETESDTPQSTMTEKRPFTEGMKTNKLFAS